MRKRSMQESSEGEEEEKRLRSCVVDYSSLTPSAARPIDHQVEEGAADDHHLKFYQVRLQDQLHEFLDKTVEIIRAEEEPDRPVAAPSQEEDDGFHLFGKAPAGITMIERVRDGSLEHRASGKRYIHSTRGCFSSGKNSLENVVIDGESVRVEAEKAREKALAAWKDRISRKEEAIARENSRVAALKQVRDCRYQDFRKFIEVIRFNTVPPEIREEWSGSSMKKKGSRERRKLPKGTAFGEKMIRSCCKEWVMDHEQQEETKDHGDGPCVSLLENESKTKASWTQAKTTLV
ncbi:hypothetical protein SELMODRAFT_413900 [Selaginella moellendorffii]|uniref:Uncharacterized protein n=1 Tax=Selaginella moellendorffii TaxID=88036 RepID=D8RQZ9_SELML|nr:hypothetical protein SELMODRAFT_413900 [Selaginella moellendorffii]